MMRRLFLLALSIPLLLKGQSREKGIRFELGLNWMQIIEKARAENKYIFVDCYATWCSPCKYMDREVYPNEKVGEYMNNRFISLKVQMDTAKNDGEKIKSWYGDAKSIRDNFKVGTLPSYLFFSPAGIILHREQGAVNDTNFLKIAANAVNPETQYYSLLQKYYFNNKDYSKMAVLAMKAKRFGDAQIANAIATDFMLYLDKLPDSALCKKENIEFMDNFSGLFANYGTRGRYFGLLYDNPTMVDSVMNMEGFADYKVKDIIRKEEIDNVLWLDGKPVTLKPDWKGLISTIEKKHNIVYALNLVLDAQIFFYRKIGNWKKYADYVEMKMEVYPPRANGKKFGGALGDTWELNGRAWDVFLNCSKEFVLKRALIWSDLSIKFEKNPDLLVQFYDTKANLLYKLGRNKEAIACEEKAIETDTENAKRTGKERGIFFAAFNKTIAKMKLGEPTWTMPNSNKE